MGRSYNGAVDAAVRIDLESGLDALAIDRAHAPALLDYLSLLARWNRTYNLTAVRDLRQMVPRHLLDSLAMAPFVAGVAKLADLGAGAGLPGIPLAIVRRELRVTLVESNGKKARFLREAVRRLGLANADIVQARIEDFDAPGAFDAITARALATLPQILALGGRLLAPRGRLLAMKGALPQEEIAALPPGWEVRAVHPLQVPGLAAERHLVVVGRKAGPTEG